MTFKTDMPPRTHACWDDAQWRTDKLREVKAASGLGLIDLAAISGIPYTSLRHFHSGKWHQISKNELRLMIFELKAR